MATNPVAEPFSLLLTQLKMVGFAYGITSVNRITVAMGGDAVTVTVVRAATPVTVMGNAGSAPAATT